MKNFTDGDYALNKVNKDTLGERTNKNSRPELEKHRQKPVISISQVHQDCDALKAKQQV